MTLRRQAATEANPPRSMAGRVVRELDRQPWADFVLAHRNGSIYHTPEMHQVFAQTRRHRPAVWAAVDAAGAIRALMAPVEICAIGGPFRALATRAVVFGGPLVALSPDNGHRVLSALLEAYQRRGSRAAVFTEIRNLADTTALAPDLAATGFRHEPHLNFLVDLTPAEEQLWLRVAASARRNVRKAGRTGVTIEEARDPAEIPAGYAVLRDVYHRLGVPLPDRSLFDACFEILGPRGWFKMLLARLEDRTVGVLTLLRYKQVVHYWYTGTLRTHPPCRAADLLAWHAIRSSRADGYRTLDFGGAGKPDEPYGVRDFKAKYGGQLVDFGRDVWVQAPQRLRLSTAGYGLLRRFL